MQRSKTASNSTRAAPQAPGDPFQSFISQQLERFGTAQRLADAIGMSLSAFSRGVRKTSSLGVKSCLLLAEQTGEAPGRVLRLAGKGDVAELIERLYGTRAPTAALSAPERELLALWNALSPSLQQALSTLMGSLPVAKRARRTLRAKIGPFG